MLEVKAAGAPGNVVGNVEDGEGSEGEGVIAAYDLYARDIDEDTFGVKDDVAAKIENIIKFFKANTVDSKI